MGATLIARGERFERNAPQKVAALLLVSSFLGLLLSGCFYTLERNRDSVPGSIAGRAVDDAGSPIPFAKVQLLGSGISFRANDAGIFRTQALDVGGWTLRISQDTDQDGFIDRGAVVRTTLTKQVHPGEADPRLVSVDLGDVKLLGVGSVSGSVRLEGDLLPGARVVVERVASDGIETTTVGVEAQGTAEEGTFVIPNLIPGQVSVVATAQIDGADFVSQARIVDVTDGAPPDVALDLVPAEGTRSVRVATSPQPAATDGIEVTLTGAQTGETFEGLTFDAPVGGAWNVRIRNTSALSSASLPGQIVPPGNGTLVWGPVGLINDADRCVPIGVLFDCDRDTLPGLPVLERDADGNLPAAELNLWRDCAEQCTEVGSQQCSTGGTIYDCDDDGDGQSDLTEPPECYGVDLGTDLDGDGICDPIDPHPGCDDRPVVFDCSTVGVLPPLWFEYDDTATPPVDAGLVDAGNPDAGPGDAGNPDAGPGDAGDPDAGPGDAGNPDAGPGDAGILDAGPIDVDGGPDGGDDGGLVVPDAGDVDAGPPPIPSPPATGFRTLPVPPAPSVGPKRLLEQQFLPAARVCDPSTNRCVTGGLVP